MESRSLFEIAFALRGRLEGGERGMTVRGACIDSRRAKPGDLFFALPGPNADGARFVGDALARGAAAAVVADGADLSGQEVPRNRVLRVADPVRALWDLADWVRRDLRVPVIGITGSCGKTTTREMIHAVLAAALGEGVRSPASFNNHLGVPATLLEIEDRHAFAVVEMGTNHPGEIAALAALARPRVGVVTNIRSAHLEGFGDLYGVAREKGSLFAALPPDGLAVYNPAELGLAAAARRARAASLTFGASPRCALRLERVRETAEGLDLRINGVPFQVPVHGARLAWNVLAAAAVACAFGVALPDAARALATFHAPEGRLSRRRVGGVTVFNDAYNANPASMRAALETLKGFPDCKRRVLVLGDMLELGDAALRAHTELGRRAAEAGPDLTVSVGRFVSATIGAMMARGIPAERIRHFEDSDQASREVPGLLADGDVVLLKASRGLRFERILSAIEERFQGVPAASPG